MLPVLITPEGRVVTTDTPTTPAIGVEPFVEESLDVIAAKQHAKDSTKKDTK